MALDPSNVGRFASKSVLIVGGAAGIGRAIVEKIASEGGRVLFSDIDGAAGAELAGELTELGYSVRFHRSDATQEDAMKELVAAAVAGSGRLDVAINNVGFRRDVERIDMTLDQITLDVWTRSIGQNLTSCFLGMKFQIEQMLTTGGGVIANTSSLAGMRVAETTPSYTAAKAGVNQLTRYFAVKYARNNIRVNAVAPGVTATPLLIEALPDEAERDLAARQWHPLGKLVTPSNIADAFAWICSEDAAMVTGQVIPVDGGWSAT